jgi:hypothetical protein
MNSVKRNIKMKLINKTITDKFNTFEHQILWGDIIMDRIDDSENPKYVTDDEDELGFAMWETGLKRWLTQKLEENVRRPIILRLRINEGFRDKANAIKEINRLEGLGF